MYFSGVLASFCCEVSLRRVELSGKRGLFAEMERGLELLEVDLEDPLRALNLMEEWYEVPASLRGETTLSTSFNFFGSMLPGGG